MSDSEAMGVGLGVEMEMVMRFESFGGGVSFYGALAWRTGGLFRMIPLHQYGMGAHGIVRDGRALVQESSKHLMRPRYRWGVQERSRVVSDRNP